MTHEIICTENYLLVVDKNRPTDWYYNETDNRVDSAESAPTVIGGTIVHNIIAHLPLNGASILDGVDLLPPLPDEVENLANEEFPDESTPGWKDSFSPRERRGFIAGYNKAKEKYKYTEEDLVRAFNIGVNSQFESTELKLNKDESIDRHSKNLLKLIQSLQQSKMPVGFESEQSLCFPSHCFRDCDMMCKYPRPKTTTNIGFTQWVGKYTY
jgi:hypothetical protein